DTATDKAKPAIAINLNILYLHKPSDNLDFSQQRKVQLSCSSLRRWSPRRLEVDQGLCDGRAGSSRVSGRTKDYKFRQLRSESDPSLGCGSPLNCSPSRALRYQGEML